MRNCMNPWRRFGLQQLPPWAFQWAPLLSKFPQHCATAHNTGHRPQGPGEELWVIELHFGLKYYQSLESRSWLPWEHIAEVQTGGKEWHFMPLIYCCSPLTLTEQCKWCSELCSPKALEISVWFDTHILLKGLIREWEATSWPQEAQRNGRKKPDMVLSTQTSNSQSTFFFGPIYSCFFFL